MPEPYPVPHSCSSRNIGSNFRVLLNTLQKCEEEKKVRMTGEGRARVPGTAVDERGTAADGCRGRGGCRSGGVSCSSP